MSPAFNNRKADFFIKGILDRDVAVLGRAITLVESKEPAQQKLGQEVLSGLMKETGRSFRLGVTGVPGVGKSTFIESFGKQALKEGHRLAVLAIDPTSGISKGSILGDKTRMEELSGRDDVYIRPSPSSGSLGGVTKATYESILLCEAAGYDFIIVETVGVGQSEIAVSRITDFFLLLMLAGAGDELQGIKRGIMEMADGLLITKDDGDNRGHAREARAEYARALHMLQPPESGWIPKTLTCSALTGQGIGEVYKMIREYDQFAKDRGYFEKKRRAQQYDLFLQAIEEQLIQKLFADARIAAEIEKIRKMKSIQPFEQARRLVEEFLK